MKIGSTLTIPAEPSQLFERFVDPDTRRNILADILEHLARKRR
jgi:hypothetical protein